MRKGRHRRFEEARALKQAVEIREEPCPECFAKPGDPHADWCEYESDEGVEADEE